eukprot:jgi/Bigna1/132046/aug1.16_g6754
MVASGARNALPAHPRLFHETDVVHRSGGHSSQWKWTGKANPNEQIDLVLAVKQSNVHLLETIVLATSDPDSIDYGNHLSWKEVNKLVAPSSASLGSILQYLSSFQINTCETSPSGDFVRCIVTVSTAEALLDTEYHRYEHIDNPAISILRTAYYSLPKGVSEYIDFVSPTVRFPSLQKKAKRKDIGGYHPARKQKGHSPRRKEHFRMRTNTPHSLRELYKLGNATGTLGKQACTAFLEQYYEKPDLSKFWRDFYPSEESKTRISSIGPDKSKAGIEANLDIEFLSTIGNGIATEFWSFPGRAPDNPENEPFLSWMYQVANTSDADVPKVFSTSYGEAEHTVSAAYMNRINIEFQKAAARGISLLFATGDYGVTDQGDCPVGGKLQGQWPAGSPWVTGVGGTVGGTSEIPEHAWKGSAGGFSNQWPQPAYQKQHVKNYFDSAMVVVTGPLHMLLPASNRYNGSKCGFPDVSAQADNFLVIDRGELLSVAGTSCSSPTFSGIVSLLNDIRLRANKSTLGFLNPLFYKHPSIFNDIVEGSNRAGGRCGDRGFPASKGWDPVTGLGTPNFPKMEALVRSLK